MRLARGLLLAAALLLWATGTRAASEETSTWIPVRGSAVLRGDEPLARWRAQQEALSRGLAVALARWLSERELQENLTTLEPVFFAQPNRYVASVSDPTFERRGYRLIWTAKVRYDATQIVAALHRVGLLSPRDRRPTLLATATTTDPVVDAWRRILEGAGILTTTDPTLESDGTLVLSVVERRPIHPFERDRRLRARFLAGTATVEGTPIAFELPIDGPWAISLTAATEPLVARILELWGAAYRRHYRAQAWHIEGLVFPDVPSWLAFDEAITHARHVFNDVHPTSLRWHEGRLEVSYGFFLPGEPVTTETGPPAAARNAWAWLQNAGWRVELDPEGQRFVVSLP